MPGPPSFWLEMTLWHDWNSRHRPSGDCPRRSPRFECANRPVPGMQAGRDRACTGSGVLPWNSGTGPPPASWFQDYGCGRANRIDRASSSAASIKRSVQRCGADRRDHESAGAPERFVEAGKRLPLQKGEIVAQAPVSPGRRSPWPAGRAGISSWANGNRVEETAGPNDVAGDVGRRMPTIVIGLERPAASWSSDWPPSS